MLSDGDDGDPPIYTPCFRGSSTTVAAGWRSDRACFQRCPFHYRSNRLEGAARAAGKPTTLLMNIVIFVPVGKMLLFTDCWGRKSSIALIIEVPTSLIMELFFHVERG